MNFQLKKNANRLYRKILILFFASCFTASGFAQSAVTPKDSMVQKFYTINPEPLYWYSTRKDTKRAAEWLTAIEAAKDAGLVSRKLMTGEIRTAMLGKNIRNKVAKANADKQITGVVLNFLKELQSVSAPFQYDEVSTPQNDSIYIYQLINSKNKGPVSKIVSALDCQNHDYQALKKFIKDSIPDKNSLKYKSVVLSMNYLKYIDIYNQSEYIVANIPETEVKYFQNGKLKLQMKSVVGKKKSHTQTIASYITNIVTFPF